MPEGTTTLKNWLVHVGDRVEVHQTVAIIETGKALIDFPAHTSGLVLTLVVGEGDPVSMNALILIIREP